MTIKDLHKKLGAMMKIRKDIGELHLWSGTTGKNLNMVVLANICMPPVKFNPGTKYRMGYLFGAKLEDISGAHEIGSKRLKIKPLNLKILKGVKK